MSERESVSNGKISGQKHGKYLFNPNAQALQSSFEMTRKRVAERLHNPRLLQIRFHTLRYLKGTLEYHKTHDILYVKQILGHKRLENTEIYAHLVEFPDGRVLCGDWEDTQRGTAAYSGRFRVRPFQRERPPCYIQKEKVKSLKTISFAEKLNALSTRNSLRVRRGWNLDKGRRERNPHQIQNRRSRWSISRPLQG